MNSQRLLVWASIARDYLAIMASSVSSEQTFSSAGITLSKRQNRLKGDIVEALQFLICLLHRYLLFQVPFTTADEFDLESDESLEGLAAEVDRSTLVTDDSEWIVLDDGSKDWEDVVV
jgi:hypothetical protein